MSEPPWPQAQGRAASFPDDPSHRVPQYGTALHFQAQGSRPAPRPSHSPALPCPDPTAFIPGTELLAPLCSAGCVLNPSPPPAAGRVNHCTKQWEGFLGTAALRGTAVWGTHFQLPEHPDTFPPAFCPPPPRYHHAGDQNVVLQCLPFSFHCAKNSPAMPAGRCHPPGWMDGCCP